MQPGLAYARALSPSSSESNEGRGRYPEANGIYRNLRSFIGGVSAPKG